TTQPAGRNGVTHDAGDVDTVGRADEPVPLAQGLHDHVVPEVLVQVGRRGKVSGDVNRGLLNWGLRDVDQRIRVDDAVSDVQMWLPMRTAGGSGRPPHNGMDRRSETRVLLPLYIDFFASRRPLRWSVRRPRGDPQLIRLRN